MKNLSIRWRIALPYILLLLVTMLALGVYLSNFIRQTYLDELQTQLLGQARIAGEALASSPGDWSNPQKMDAVAKRWSSILDERVTLIAPDGTVLGESGQDPSQLENHLDRPEIQQALTEGKGNSIRPSATNGYPMMYSAVPVTVQGKLLGFVRLALPLQEIQGRVDKLRNSLVAATLLAALLIIGLATLITGRTARALRELTEAVEQMSDGQDDGFEPTTQDEIGRLTQAFNRMSVQLRGQINDLETERSKLAAVLQEMTDGVLIIDSQGLVTLLNPAAEKIFGISGEAASERSLAELLRNHQVVDLWEHCRDTGQPQAETIEIPSKHVYLQGLASPLGQALPGSTLLVFQNLTRVRQLETVRRDFISNISHELRTPLASLKALTETLQEGALEDPPAARRFLARMETEVDALSQMVAELLELSRIESGRVPLNLEIVPPEEILTSAVDRLHHQAERAGVTVRTECPRDLPTILADHNRLEQVLVNLLHNAIKFTPSGGEIILGAGQENGMIVFSVRDTGIGIPKTDLSRIFERFYKTDRSRSSGGTGLGLAIARHMVEAHGGRIWAVSQEGEGSTFYFTIPIAS